MPRIAIVGPGAVGGVIAAWLAHTDKHEIVLCARRPLGGELVVETPEETLRAALPVCTDPAAAPVVDWVIVATKAYDSAAAARWFDGLCAEGAPVAIVQNGVEHRERFAPFVPPARLLPVLAYCPAERTSPTQLQQRRKAWLVTTDEPMGRDFAALFAGSKMEVRLTSDFVTAAWEKLCVNAPGILNALLLQPTGVFRQPTIASIARHLLHECIAVARAEGAALDDSMIERVFALYRSNPDNSVNSLHADRVAGRPMEIEARNGAIVRLGHKHGIPTPCNEMAVALLEAAALGGR